MRTREAVLLWLVVVLASSCTPDLRRPVPVDSSFGVLDLRAWNFERQGPVAPQGWLWDPQVLWSPQAPGRPTTLPDALALGAPDLGGSLAAADLHRGPVAATAWIKILVPGDRGYGLQVGAFPGATRVWVNSVLVWEAGVVSPDRALYRAGNSGTLITVQPVDGELSLVVDLVADDPLVGHSEMNRVWLIGPADSMLTADGAEQRARALQATILGFGLLVFLWISRFRPERTSIRLFTLFLAVCLLKLVFNVEQPHPWLASLFPGLPLSSFLFLNHGLNLWPFPCFFFFLHRQFPGEVSRRSVLIATGVTVLGSLWELFPFVALSGGWTDAYQFVIHLPWSFALNLYVVAVTLFLFERFYQIYRRRRPLAGGLFWGGIVLGLLVLIPVPLSFFTPVKHTYFLGWGLLLYLVILALDLIRLQIRTTEGEIRRLESRGDDLEVLRRFIPAPWASWVGRSSVESIRPGDHRPADLIVIRVSCEEDPERWLPEVGKVASARLAALLEWRPGMATWVLEGWSETGLAFALEVQRRLEATVGLPRWIVMTRTSGEFRVLDLGQQWQPTVSGVSFDRLDHLDAQARRSGVSLVIDGTLQDGLVVGGWHRHRRFTLEGSEIEVYEAEVPVSATLKDQSLEAFEEALSRARAGEYARAVELFLAIVHQNPFDTAARALLNECSWHLP